MAEKITLRTAVDVFVTPSQPARYGLQRLYVGTEAQVYLFFNLPTMPSNAQITSAKVVAFAGGALAALTSGFPSLTLHTVTSLYDANRLTWDNRPTESAAVETETAPTDATADRWEWDCTAEMADAISTGVWYGFTIKSGTATSDHYLWSSSSAAPMYLEITWTAPPPQPVDLLPADGAKISSNKPTVSWNSGTSGGGEQAYSIQVQVANNSGMTTSLWDSGEVFTKSSLLDLSTTSFPAITAGQTRWWRVRTKNTSGLWGPWSVSVSFVYMSPGVLTITAPATSMSTPAPQVTWTFTGATQQAYQVYITGYGQIYDSGIVYTTTMNYQVPQGIWNYDNETYRVEVRVWDTNDRININAVPNFISAVRNVTLVGGAAPAPVQLLVEDFAPGYPHQLVKWQYTSATPVSLFQINRFRYPGDPTPVIYRRTPAESAIPGQPTWYQFADGFVAGRTEVTYQVRTISSTGVFSTGEIYLPKTIRHAHPWLFHVSDIDRRIALVNADIDPGMSEVTDVVHPISAAPYLVAQSYRGFIGTATGIMANGVVDGLSARQMKENLRYMRKNPRCYLVWADECIECYIYDTKIRPVPTADGSTDYSVSFGFIEILGQGATQI